MFGPEGFSAAVPESSCFMNVFSFQKNYFVDRLAEEAARAGIDLCAFDTAAVSCMPSGICCGGEHVPMDCSFYFRGSVDGGRRELVRSVSAFAEERGSHVVNPSWATAVSSNKWLCRQRLEGRGLPVPRGCLVSSRGGLPAAADALGGFPLLAKTFYGCGGTGVVLVSGMMEMRSVFDFMASTGAGFFFEEFVGPLGGCSKRALCIGGEIVAEFVMRPCGDDFRSNSAKGGRWTAGGLEDSERMLALRAAGSCGLDFASVDMIDGIVLEVNSSPGIERAEAETGRNIASIFLRAFCRV